MNITDHVPLSDSEAASEKKRSGKRQYVLIAVLIGCIGLIVSVGALGLTSWTAKGGILAVALLMAFFCWVEIRELEYKLNQLDVLSTEETEHLSELLQFYPAGRAAVAHWLDMGRTIRKRDFAYVMEANAQHRLKRSRQLADKKLKDIASGERHMNGFMTERDHLNLTTFLGTVLDEYRDGTATKDDAVGSLAHVIAAIDQGNIAEARMWFEQGRKFMAQQRRQEKR